MIAEIKYGKRIQGEMIDFTFEECITCGCPFFMPTTLRNRCKEDSAHSFHCPNGHSMVFRKSEADKVREELEQVKIENQRNKEMLQDKLLDTINEKIKLEKKLKRVHNGVCPCCNRSFQNLQKHMTTKHPDVVKPSK